MKEIEEEVISNFIVSASKEAPESEPLIVKKWMIHHLIETSGYYVIPEEGHNNDFVNFAFFDLVPIKDQRILGRPSERIPFRSPVAAVVICKFRYRVCIEKVGSKANNYKPDSKHPFVFNSAFFTFGNIPKLDWENTRVSDQFKTIIPVYNNVKTNIRAPFDIVRYPQLYNEIHIKSIMHELIHNTDDIVFSQMTKDVPPSLVKGLELGNTLIDFNVCYKDFTIENIEISCNKIIENFFTDLIEK